MFPGPVQPPRDGEPDNASTIGRPISQIDANVQRLYDILNAVNAGNALFRTDVGLSPDCQIGMPVYWSPVDQIFHPAIAATSNLLGQGVVGVSAASRVLGVVYDVRPSGIGDLLIAGTAKLDISAANDDPGPPGPGLYYLSGADAGMVTLTKSPITIPIYFYDGESVYMKIQDLDFLDRHTHYKFPLVCQPAGTTFEPVFGGVHVITAPDPTKHGWLPASHPIFNGLAPAGAFFGYNLSLEPDLANALPPIPISGAYLGWDRGLDINQGEEGARLGNGGFAIIDRNGIWWMTDCYQQVPWPFDWPAHHIDPISEEPGECPVEAFMRLTLYFSRPIFATDGAVVTSLRTGDPRISITCFGKTPPTPAAVGDLDIELNLNLSIAQPTTFPGNIVFKGINAQGLIEAGPVVETIYPLSSNIIMNSAQQVVDPVSGRVYNYGTVGIDVVPNPTQQLPVTTVRLDANAEEDDVLDVPVIALRAGFDSRYRAMISVPSTLGSGAHHVSLRFIIMGRIAGTLPPLTITTRLIPRPPSGLSPPVNLPTSEGSLMINNAGVLTTVNQYVEAVSQAIAVNPGDTLAFFVYRTGSTDGYAGDVAIIDQVGVLSSS